MKLKSILAAVFLLLSFSLMANEAFVIDRYSVEMDVGEDNSYEVTETLELDFSADRHGIIRDIPLYFDDMPVVISKIRVPGYETSISQDREYTHIRIGSADTYVRGKVKYTISYHYDVGADNLPDMDEFNFNLIGVQWDTQVKEGDFRITLPKAFDASRVNCTSGPYGSTDNSGVEWTVEGNVIEGKLIRSLNNYEGLTVALPLPEGYWVGAKKHRPPFWFIDTVVAYALFALAAVLSFLLWLAKGRDNQLFPTVQFEPPQGMTPAEIGYIIDGSVDNKDVTSLIIYWAEKGYLAIEEVKNGRGKTTELALIKLGVPGSDARSYEKKIFKDLFKSGSGGRVTTKDLTNSFYKTLSWGVRNVTKTFTDSKENRIFVRSSGGTTFLAFLLSMVPMSFMGVRTVGQLGGGGPLWVFCIFFAIFTSVFYVQTGTFISNLRMGQNGGKVMVVLAIVSTVLIGALVVFEFDYPLVKYLAAVGSSFTAAFFASIMSKRTEYGDKILEKVLGFRDFIKEAESDKLEMMFESNPSYFYHILPYAMVLGLSDKWSSHFDSLAVEPPDWYRGNRYDRFNTRDFERDLSRSFGSLSGAMSSSPSSSGGSSGSSSSGGSSGGGAGGGGGSSW
ncbi:MAG: DUF2207 domain-containing protein [Spirochaetales bacterium]|nr:DUF2207 domain-containing protein [Spirochaetales bacterium]